MTADDRRYGGGRSAALVLAELSTIESREDRRSARVSFREEALLLRLQARHSQSVAKLADAMAKFGGGSLLTATLLLIIGGHAGTAAVATAALALFLFVAGTICYIYWDRLAARSEYRADWLEAILEEAEL